MAPFVMGKTIRGRPACRFRLIFTSGWGRCVRSYVAGFVPISFLLVYVMVTGSNLQGELMGYHFLE